MIRYFRLPLTSTNLRSSTLTPGNNIGMNIKSNLKESPKLTSIRTGPEASITGSILKKKHSPRHLDA